VTTRTVSRPVRGFAAPPFGALSMSLIVGAFLTASAVLAVALGAAGLSPAEVWASIWAHLTGSASPLSSTRDAIVWQLRVPRVLTAAAVGAGLGLCGAVLQSVTRNPLADPYLLGLSSGASLGAVAVILLGATIALPVAAFAGALGALLMTLALSYRSDGLSPTRAVLAGLAVSALLGALTSLVIFWSATGDSYREVLGWLLGSLAGSTWTSVLITLTAIVVVGIPLILGARALDSFALGDRVAASLGVAVGRTRWSLLVGTTLLTAAMVSVSGSIGFVGLLVPHAVRLCVGAGHRRGLPLSAAFGAILMVWADTLARTVFEPRELPVGVLTAILGAPVFAILLLRRRSA
jgi:iron complex transport system permease protein